MRTVLSAEGLSTQASPRDLGSLFVAQTSLGQLLITLCASLFVALCAHFTVPLPFTPVPLTLSDFAVLLVGLVLGPQMGFAALALYLAEGLCGLPVFAPGGPGGIAQLLGPTGGFLIAYPFAAALAGGLVRGSARIGRGPSSRFGWTMLAAAAGSTLLMCSGAGWFGLYTHHDATLTLRMAVLPFLPGQVVKILSAAGLADVLARWQLHRSPR